MSTKESESLKFIKYGERIAQGIADGIKSVEEPRHPFLIKRLNIPSKSVPKDWPSVKKLLDTAPVLGVERAVTELRFTFEEKEQQAFFEQCGRMKVDPDALLKTAEKNAELMAELSKQQDRVTRALREVKDYLLRIIEEWMRLPDIRRLEAANLQVYNHVRKELDDLEALAAKYEVDLEEEAEK